MQILGISAFYHDSAAALVVDGQLVAAAQEERFTRKKHDSRFPQNAIRSVLACAGLRCSELDAVTFYDKPFLKFERLLETYLAFAPRGFTSFRAGFPLWVKDKLFQKREILKELAELDATVEWQAKLLFSEHHLSHAASAFYPSPFQASAVLTMDGVGEWTTTSLAIGSGKDLKVIKEIFFPHSIGLLYSAFTYYTGFKVNSGEYKVMGLAPYGRPIYSKLIRDHIVEIKPDGSFRLDMQYFDYCTGLTMTNERFDALFGGPPRKAEAPLTQREMDLAASIQEVCEDIVLGLCRGIARETGQTNICLAGGVALNCVANGKLLKAGIFRDVWIQPASGDAGGAVGAAMAATHIHYGHERTVPGNGRDSMRGSYLGPEYAQAAIESALLKAGAKFQVLSETGVVEACATALADGQAIGWFQGRAEFGPRALGGRSILGDARSPSMQKLLNLKVKYRESFRPFAPTVLRENVAEWFDLDYDSPYMLLVADVKPEHRIAMTAAQQQLFGIEKLNVPRSTIPAVTHVDYSARVQTVHRDTNPRYHALISQFKLKTGCPVIVNTSFNVRGEPIVGTPEDAFRCFMGTELDVLAVGNCLMFKQDQDPALKESYEDKYELD